MAQHDRHDHGAHAHLHVHHSGRPDYGRAFAVGIVLNLAYVAAEAVFGALSGSNPTQPLPPEYPADKAFFTVTFFYNETPPR